MSNVKTAIGLKCYEWSSLTLLKDLSIEQVKLNPSKLEERQPFFWYLDEQNHYRGLRKINSVLYSILKVLRRK